MIRLGIVVMPTDPWPETLARVQRIEALGYDHVWVYDHLSWQRYHERPWHAPYPWLAALAGGTSTIRLGTLVSNPNIRHPVVLAKDAMSIDHISGGRLTIGIGAGGTGYDATVLGQEPLTPGQRARRLAEYTHVLDGLLRGSLRDHDGEWYTVDDARILPGCVQQPRLPLAVAAGGPRTIRLAADLGDAWVTYGDVSDDDLDPAERAATVAAQVELLEARCAETGRDPRSIDRILLAQPASRPLDSLDHFREYVARYEASGITDIVFHDPRPDDEVLDQPVELVDQIAAELLADRMR